MSLLKNFFYDFLKLDNASKYYIGLIDKLDVYENEYSIEYFKKTDGNNCIKS